MNKSKNFLFLIIILTGNIGFAASNLCQKAYDFTEICKTQLSDIHPSQYAVGEYSIKYKAGKIEKEWAENELDKYMQEEANPAIFGPDEKIWIIDGHHLHFALFKANIPKDLKYSYIKIIEDFRGQSFEKFQKFMLENKYVYLKDHKFLPITFKDLPMSVSMMKTNPYRSLAWIVRKHEAYEKTSVPFAEFLWGEFFKNKGIKLEGKFNPQTDLIQFKKALDLAKSPQASTLPGYIHPSNQINGQN